jgi:amino acid transporter
MGDCSNIQRYGMVATMCEEVQNPHWELPKAMVLSVVGGGVPESFIFCRILFAFPPVGILLAVKNDQPIGFLFKIVTGSAGGGFGLFRLLLGVWMFAGVGALTASSRCTYAFAWDGAIPCHHLWRKVHKGLDVPVFAVLLSALIDGLLALIYLGSSVAFNSFTGAATICLSA